MMMLLLSTYCFAADLSSEWIKFTSSDKSYAVMFPAEPKTEISKEANSTTVLTTYFFEKRIGLISGYTDYDMIPDVQKELVANQDNFLKVTQATLNTSRQFQFERGPNDMLPALVFTGAGNGRSFKGIVIVDKPRTYIFVVGEVGLVGESAQRFLDSARLYKVAK